MEQDPANAAKGSSEVLSTTEAGQDFEVTTDKAPVSEPVPTRGLDGKPEELHERGLQLINEGKAEEALALLQRAVELKPTSADFHHNLGVALAHRGRLDEAIACFREALKIKPLGVSALSN